MAGHPPTRYPGIAGLRRIAGFSQRELATEAGIDRTTLDQIESGATQNPRHSTLAKISAALNVPIPALRHGIPDRTGLVSRQPAPQLVESLDERLVRVSVFLLAAYDSADAAGVDEWSRHWLAMYVVAAQPGISEMAFCTANLLALGGPHRCGAARSLSEATRRNDFVQTSEVFRAIAERDRSIYQLQPAAEAIAGASRAVTPHVYRQDEEVSQTRRMAKLTPVPSPAEEAVLPAGNSWADHLRTDRGAERPPALWTVKQASRYLKVDETTVRRWAAKGRFSVIRLSAGCVRFDPAELWAFVASSRTTSSAAPDARVLAADAFLGPPSSRPRRR